MSEVKDPKIKLFGRTIELPEAAAEVGEGAEYFDAISGEDSSNQDPVCSSTSMLEYCNLNGDEKEDQESHKGQSDIKQNGAKEEDRACSLTSDEFKDSNTILPLVEDVGAEQPSKPEEDQTETGNSEEKTLKKPDKILPCPRCNSMDTKFCYFNNYNVNQPRHFCKNCQRYWTAGGTMRNVPVGAGRRKNKSSASQFRHLTVPEASQVDLSSGIHHPNGTVLTFSSDTPLCESMVSVLNIADKTRTRGSKEKEDGCSNDEVGKSGPLETEHPRQVHFFPRAPWPYPCLVSQPTFGPSFMLPFYSSTPPAYWGYSIPGSWNVPWSIPPSSNSCLNSPTLGKHLREDNIMKTDNLGEETGKKSDPGKCLWVPKTLRIDDPGEAAKSSIWATLGIKNDRVDSVGRGGLFKDFQSQSKGDETTQDPETSAVLQANPAALSRSVSFRESS